MNSGKSSVWQNRPINVSVEMSIRNARRSLVLKGAGREFLSGKENNIGIPQGVVPDNLQDFHLLSWHG